MLKATSNIIQKYRVLKVNYILSLPPILASINGLVHIFWVFLKPQK